MGRLTRHDYNEDAYDICKSWVLCKGKDCILYDIYEKLAHYEDLEEAGRLIELPCALGDTVYVVGTKCLEHKEMTEAWCDAQNCCECVYDKEYAVFEKIVEEFILYELILSQCPYYILNENVFLTKEEALAKLKELEGDKCR